MGFLNQLSSGAIAPTPKVGTQEGRGLFGIPYRDVAGMAVRGLSAFSKQKPSAWYRMQNEITKGMDRGKKGAKRRQLKSALKDLVTTSLEGMQPQQAQQAIQQIHQKYDLITADEMMNLVKTYRAGRDYFEDRAWKKEQKGQTRKGWDRRAVIEGREDETYQATKDKRTADLMGYENEAKRDNAVRAVGRILSIAKTPQEINDSIDLLMPYANTKLGQKYLDRTEKKINQLQESEKYDLLKKLREAQIKSYEALAGQRKREKSESFTQQSKRTEADKKTAMMKLASDPALVNNDGLPLLQMIGNEAYWQPMTPEQEQLVRQKAKAFGYDIAVQTTTPKKEGSIFGIGSQEEVRQVMDLIPLEEGSTTPPMTVAGQPGGPAERGTAHAVPGPAASPKMVTGRSGKQIDLSGKTYGKYVTPGQPPPAAQQPEKDNKKEAARGELNQLIAKLNDIYGKKKPGKPVGVPIEKGSYTKAPSKEMREAGYREIQNAMNKLGVGAGNWKSLWKVIKGIYNHLAVKPFDSAYEMAADYLKWLKTSQKESRQRLYEKSRPKAEKKGTGLLVRPSNK